jgi:hypothetical protein
VTDEQTAWRDVSRLSKRSLAAPDTPPAALLELGSGGGSPACHLKERLALTLSDRSAAMLAVIGESTLSASTCCGLFPRAAWLAWIEEAGFAPSVRMEPWGRDVFTGKKTRRRA